MALLSLGIRLYIWQFVWVAPEGQMGFLHLYEVPLRWPVSRFLGDMGTGGRSSMGVTSMILMGAVVSSGYRRGGDKVRGEQDGPTL